MKKRIFYVSISLLFLFYRLNAQYENVWVFGSGLKQEVYPESGCGLDFNGNNPQPLKTAISGFGEGNASVCNEEGQLLFYTEGSYIWDQKGKLMANGEHLTDLPLNPPFGFGSPTASTSQGALIVPVPDDPHRFYVFSLSCFEQENNMGRLYYSMVNMELNNGMGDVELKGVLIDSNLTERMTGVVGDKCNIWVLVYSLTEPAYKAFEITSSGINVDPVISFTSIPFDASGIFGCLIASPDRRKIAMTRTNLAGGAYVGIELSDFDPLTGVVSNTVPLDTMNGYYGLCFSSNGKMLYASNNNIGSPMGIYQFDITAANNSFLKTFVGASAFSHLKLAPNGKIYFQSNVTVSDNRDVLGCVNYPDLSPPACQYTDNAISLLPNTKMHAGLPNVFPVFRHDSIYTSKTMRAPCFVNTNPITIHALNDSTGWDYVWYDGNYGPKRSIDTPGSYWISYHTSPCVYNVDTFHVSFPNGILPNIHISASCKNDKNGKAFASTYPSDTVTYYYTWKDGRGNILSMTDTLSNMSAGLYALQIRTAKCDTVLKFIIPEEDHTASFQVDSIVCQDGELQFRNTSDAHFSSFSWDFGDSNHSLLNNPVHVFKQAGSYQVTLSANGEVCSSMVIRLITVDALTGSYFTKNRDSVCVGEAIIFTHEIDTITLTGLNWQTGDGSSFSGMNYSIGHAYDIAGQLSVTLTARFRACPDTAYTDTIHVFEPPKVDLGHDGSICLNGTPVYLKNLQPETEGAFRYSWNTGDTTETLKVVHPGRYSLTVSSYPMGCGSTESIEVKKSCYIDIPNAFRPDGDGFNDYFFPRQLLSKDITQFKMQIFNRWGQLVFETSNIDGRGWDGRFNGKEQPAGVYVYRITIETDGQTEHYDGNVTLIR